MLNIHPLLWASYKLKVHCGLGEGRGYSCVQISVSVQRKLINLVSNSLDSRPIMTKVHSHSPEPSFFAVTLSNLHISLDFYLEMVSPLYVFTKFLDGREVQLELKKV